MDNKVKTISGKSVSRKHVRKISGKYYEENVDCFLIDGRWNRRDNGLVAFDLNTKKWGRIKNMVESGKIPLIIGVSASGEMEIGYTNQRKELFIPLYDPSASEQHVHLGGMDIALYAINEKLAKQLGYTEVYSSEHFVKGSKTDSTMQISRNSYPFSLEYNLKDYTKGSLVAEATSHFKDIASPTLKLTDREIYLGKFFKGHTFGLEYETCEGYLPIRTMYETGLMPLRDGSISGTEYVSVPMSAPHGLRSVKEHCELLKRRTLTNQYCSLHLHIGGISKDPFAMIALYCLCYRVQEEIHEMLPPFKRSIGFLKSKDKDHARLLKSLDIVYNNGIMEAEEGASRTEATDAAFKRVWAFLTGGSELTKECNPKTGKHPQEGRQKWHWFPRYHWVNFLNIYFGPGTVEFRCHQATSSFIQVSNWMFICLAIVRYAEEYSKEIISGDYKINLEEILYGYTDNFGTEEESEEGSTITNFLISYSRHVKDIHTADYIANQVNYSAYSRREKQLEKIGFDNLKQLY